MNPQGLKRAYMMLVIAAAAARERAARDLGDPIGVARILAFLASDDADYVRGTIFTR